VHAQQDSTWVPYVGGFDFREGLYADFPAFRNNAPTYPMHVLQDGQGLPVEDLRNFSGRLYWRPDTGEAREIDLSSMWGFCNNNVIHVRAGSGFYRMGMMGSIAHLLYEYQYRDWDPYMYPGGTVVRTAQGQLMLDVETGRFMDMNASTMEELLARDPLLSAEYAEVPVKKRKQEVLFLFMRRYNDRHPLYFPQ
jgi:hypothetical protein